MNPGGARLTGRDFKHARRAGGGAGFARYRQFAAGLALGLVVAIGAFVAGQRSAGTPAEEAQPRPQPRPSPPGETAAVPEDAPADYQFYDMLPKFEVVLPERDGDVRRDAPAAKVTQPGAYVLQAGSYSRQEDAERVRAQLGRLGIDAVVQRVAVDTEVWHRVRIGPTRDLDQVNRLRAQLRQADYDALVMRVAD